MATLHPFRAVRPVPEKAGDIASVPYDVISVAEARKLAEGNPASFLHVIRPEIDLPEDVDEHDDAVYRTGAENMRKFVDADYTLQDESPCLYVYRQIMDGRHQTGIFGCVAVAEYDNDTILKHEKTRPVKEDDRTRHIIEQRAHAEPIMLTYRDSDRVNSIVASVKKEEALYDFTAADGVQHTFWQVSNPDALVDAFGDVSKLYVADGHHRCKAASRTAAEGPKDASDEINYFPAVVFPMGDMAILPYNRIIKSLPEAPSEFAEKLKAKFDLEETDQKSPAERGSVSIYIDGSWYSMKLPSPSSPSAVNDLDVARLGEHLLEPLLGISDPRRDPNIDFVGGIRGTAELERLVDSGKAAMAISMYPTSIEELVDVSDAGLLMPPKSTWFEPKLRSGLLVHLF